MNETGFKCPKCGWTECFTADRVLELNTRVEIVPDGWDVVDGADMVLPDNATIACGNPACSHSGPYPTFAVGVSHL